MKYALIDMGSNSIRLTVYDVDRDGFRVLFKEKVMAGLAGYVEKGRLSQAGIACACQSLRLLTDILDALEIENLSVFATASLRNVSNTDEAVRQIKENTGLDVEILSGEEEAECGFYGALHDVQKKDGVFVDIGGGSTELVYFSKNKVQKADSISIGSLKLYREYVKKILPGKRARNQLEEAVKNAFQGAFFDTISHCKHLVCVGGTARASLRICKRILDLPDECRSITRQQLKTLADVLCKGDMSAAELILRYEPERIHTLIPGLIILRHIAELLDVSDITVSHYGVREGYLREKIQPYL